MAPRKKRLIPGKLRPRRALLAKVYGETSDMRVAEEAAGYSKNAGYEAVIIVPCVVSNTSIK